MSRPMYEDGGNLSDEQAATTVIAEKFNCSVHKLPISYHVDFACVRSGRVVAFIEYKRRRNHSSKYPTIFISLLKVKNAVAIRDASRIPVFFVIEYDDGMRYCEISNPGKIPFSIEMGGRFDRGDNADFEPMVHYAVDKLETI